MFVHLIGRPLGLLPSALTAIPFPQYDPETTDGQAETAKLADRVRYFDESGKRETKSEQAERLLAEEELKDLLRERAGLLADDEFTSFDRFGAPLD